MKNILKIALIVLALGLAFIIFKSVQGMVDFGKEKMIRYANVAAQLEDVANTQKLYKNYYGEYTDSMDSLKQFLNEGKILIVNRRDTSRYVYDARKRIDVMKNFTIFDTIISPTSVKDSILGNRSVANFGKVVVGDKSFPVKMYASFADRIIGNDSTNIQRDHFFVGSIQKRDALYGLDEEMIEREMNDEKSPIKEDVIKVGSDSRPTLGGNWTADIDGVLRSLRIKENNAKLKNK